MMMFDLKPDAPEGIRSEFKPIATSAPGIQVCELLPLTAQWMHKTAVVRSVYHNGGCHKNLPMYTGFDANLPDEEFRDTDPPSMGSVCAYLERDRARALPPYVYVPCSLGWGEARKKGGPHGGFLGRTYDPFCTECTAFVDHPPDDMWKPQVVRGEPHLGSTGLPAEVTRSIARPPPAGRSTRPAIRAAPRRQRPGRLSQASTTGVRDAFLGRGARSLRSEPRRPYPARRARLRKRSLFGSATLLARRLVERGVRFVNVSWDNYSKRFEVSKAAWDTHERNFPMLRETLLPNFDQTYSAFLADLDARGLLDETLVVTMGEMGRTPKVNAKGGVTIGRTAIQCCWRARESREASRSARPTSTRRSSKTTRSTSATSVQPSITSWALTPRCRSTIAAVAPLRSRTGAMPSTRSWSEPTGLDRPQLLSGTSMVKL